MDLYQRKDHKIDSSRKMSSSPNKPKELVRNNSLITRRKKEATEKKTTANEGEKINSLLNKYLSDKDCSKIKSYSEVKKRVETITEELKMHWSDNMIPEIHRQGFLKRIQPLLDEKKLELIHKEIEEIKNGVSNIQKILKLIENREAIIKEIKIEDCKKPNIELPLHRKNFENILIRLRNISLMVFEMLIKWSKNFNLSTAFELRSFQFIDQDYFSKMKKDLDFLEYSHINKTLKLFTKRDPFLSRLSEILDSDEETLAKVRKCQEILLGSENNEVEHGKASGVSASLFFSSRGFPEEDPLTQQKGMSSTHIPGKISGFSTKINISNSQVIPKPHQSGLILVDSSRVRPEDRHLEVIDMFSSLNLEKRKAKEPKQMSHAVEDRKRASSFKTQAMAEGKNFKIVALKQFPNNTNSIVQLVINEKDSTTIDFAKYYKFKDIVNSRVKDVNSKLLSELAINKSFLVCLELLDKTSESSGFFSAFIDKSYKKCKKLTVTHLALKSLDLIEESLSKIIEFLRRENYCHILRLIPNEESTDVITALVNVGFKVNKNPKSERAYAYAVNRKEKKEGGLGLRDEIVFRGFSIISQEELGDSKNECNGDGTFLDAYNVAFSYSNSRIKGIVSLGTDESANLLNKLLLKPKALKLEFSESFTLNDSTETQLFMKKENVNGFLNNPSAQKQPIYGIKYETSLGISNFVRASLNYGGDTRKYLRISCAKQAILLKEVSKKNIKMLFLPTKDIRHSLFLANLDENNFNQCKRGREELRKFTWDALKNAVCPSILENNLWIPEITSETLGVNKEFSNFLEGTAKVSDYFDFSLKIDEEAPPANLNLSEIGRRDHIIKEPFLIGLINSKIYDETEFPIFSLLINGSKC